MDDIDRKLLALLEENARLPVAILARKLGLARTTVQSRIERLETSGTISGYTVRLGQSSRPTLRATVLISFEPQAGASVLSRLKAIPQVREAYTPRAASTCWSRLTPTPPQNLTISLIGSVRPKG